MVDIIAVIIAMLLTGMVGGIIAGLLGVGGGIVVVPVLEILLGSIGVDPSIRMHIAVGTSLAIILPTSLSSARTHHKEKAVLTDVIRYWGPYIVIGTVLGALIAGSVAAETLYMVFGLLALAVAVKMILPLDEKAIATEVPKGITGPLLPTGIGLISAMTGIGGGSMSVPVLTSCGKPMHQAVGTSALCGTFIALPGMLGFVYTGWGNTLLPYGSLGYVNLIGVALIIPASVAFAAIGARLAHSISRRRLSVLFGLFFLVVAVRMIWRVFG